MWDGAEEALLKQSLLGSADDDQVVFFCLPQDAGDHIGRGGDQHLHRIVEAGSQTAQQLVPPRHLARIHILRRHIQQGDCGTPFGVLTFVLARLGDGQVNGQPGVQSPGGGDEDVLRRLTATEADHGDVARGVFGQQVNDVAEGHVAALGVAGPS